MKIWLSVGGALVGSMWSLSSLAAQEAPVLHADDVVGIFGDSVADGSLGQMLGVYFAACQPKKDIKSWNFGLLGVPRETMNDSLPRMDKEVEMFHPSVAILCYGLADGGFHTAYPDTVQAYGKNLQSAVRKLKSGGVRYIMLGTPGIVDPNTYPWGSGAEYNIALGELGKTALKIAREEKTGFVDVLTPMLEATDKSKKKLGQAYSLLGDGVQPNKSGGLVMAYAFLRAMGCDGDIGTITFDMADGTATATDGHTIVSADRTKLTVKSVRYPFCFGTDEPKMENSGDPRSILPFISFNQDLNRFTLLVKNPPEGRLKVTWGGQSKEFASGDLKNGINLAEEFPLNPFCDAFGKLAREVENRGLFQFVARAIMMGTTKIENPTPEALEAGNKLESVLVRQSELLRDSEAKTPPAVTHMITVEPAS